MTKKIRPKIVDGTGKGWATTSWNVFEIYYLAQEKGIILTRDQAETFLNEIECDLEEAMIKAGWKYIEGAFKEKVLDQNAQTDRQD